MPRNINDILIGGARIFIGTGQDRKELGWLAPSEMKAEQQGSTKIIKESEGGTVLTRTTDKEVHLTFSLLEANFETFKLLDPSYTEIGGEGDTEADGKGLAFGSFQSNETYQIELWTKKPDGKYRCFRLFKAQISGNFTPFIINPDSESPIPVDIVGLVDDTRPTNKNISEIFDANASKAPGGGW